MDWSVQGFDLFLHQLDGLRLTLDGLEERVAVIEDRSLDQENRLMDLEDWQDNQEESKESGCE